MRRWLVLLAVVAAVGCGDDDDNNQPDASTGPDAETGLAVCTTNLVDLDDPSVGTHTGNKVVYQSTLEAGAGELDPTSCSGFTYDTLNERAHLFTMPQRGRLVVITNSDGTPDLDSVVYVRQDCDDGGTELACNDDTNGLVSAVQLDDVAAGTRLFIVVDSVTYSGAATLPQPYQLDVEFAPIVAAGQPCDINGVTSLCEPGLVCSVATGSPVCATSLGGPSVTALTGLVRENNTSIRFDVTLADPDGDIVELYFTMLDGTNTPIDLDDDGSPDEFAVTTTDPLIGETTISTTVNFGGLSAEEIAAFQGVRARALDGTDVYSAPRDATIVHPTINDETEACGTTALECRGELACTSDVCGTSAPATAVCTAADAGTPITGTTTFTTVIGMTAPDLLQGSCFWDPGYGESIHRIVVSGTQHVRLEASTDVAPSSTMLDSYIYLRSDCDSPVTELGCNDDEGDSATVSSLASTLVIADLAPGTYYLVVDGSSNLDGFLPYGTIGVSINMQPLIESGQACEPGVDLCVANNLCYDPAGGTAGTCRTRADHIAAACSAAPALTPGTPVTAMLTRKQPSLFEGSCRFLTAVTFPEKLYTLTLAGKADVVASTAAGATAVDTVVYVLDACSATAAELGCNEDIDESLPNLRSTLPLTLNAGTYTVVVDQGSITDPDDYDLQVPDPVGYSLNVTSKPVLGAGAVCDLAGVLNRCDTGLTCTAGTPDPTCQTTP